MRFSYRMTSALFIAAYVIFVASGLLFNPSLKTRHPDKPGCQCISVRSVHNVGAGTGSLAHFYTPLFRITPSFVDPGNAEPIRTTMAGNRMFDHPHTNCES